MSQPFLLTSETDLSTDYKQKVLPFFADRVVQGTFSGVNNNEIAYAYVIHPDEIGSIVISSGRIESLIKYKELLFDLYQNGYSVFIWDHRGQGLSGRMLPQKQRGYVENFDNFVADMQQFYQTIVKPNSPHKPKLLCHSMGGAIGALYLLKHPDDFSSVVFSSPMFGIKSPIPDWAALPIINAGLGLNATFSNKAWYFIGQTDYIAVPFAMNTITHSKLRYQIFRDEYEQKPQAKLGGVTLRWLKSAFIAMEHIANSADKIELPVLVMQSGGDMVVENKAQDEVCNKLPNCSVQKIDGAKHELLMEQDQYRTPALNHVLTFFAAN
ncbi:alpha/beta fold hydrolase [Neptunicella marina]|uniref:Alpha/beta fold hydrolase n=2 Tax=Neptunicella marina TaxID=2125989 RepID=A0A8J6J0P6_9ALTE|nr:alpha/beta fold hydrolase [Neptunicella marina]